MATTNASPASNHLRQIPLGEIPSQEGGVTSVRLRASPSPISTPSSSSSTFLHTSSMLQPTSTAPSIISPIESETSPANSEFGKGFSHITSAERPLSSMISPTRTDMIDSALLAALREPRERVGLLRLETALIDFMNVDSGWLEVGGPCNSVIIGPQKTSYIAASNASSLRPPSSFQRCILHRLADRFGIVREAGSILSGSIRLIKLPDSQIPTQLLQDLQPVEYAIPTNGTSNMSDSLEQHAIVTTQDTLSNLSLVDASVPAAATVPTQSPAPVNSTTTSSKPRKMKIMKRSDRSILQQPPLSSISTSSTSRSNSKTHVLQHRSSDVSEKERAYAEARARIFREDGEASNQNSVENASDAFVVSTTNGTSQTDLATLNSFNSSDAQQPSAHWANNLNGSNASLSLNMNTNRQDGLSGLETKAVYRNRAEEAADPDFRRGTAAPAMGYATAPILHSGLPPSTIGTMGGGPAPMMNSAIPQHLNPSMWPPTTASPYQHQHHQHHLLVQPHPGMHHVATPGVANNSILHYPYSGAMLVTSPAGTTPSNYVHANATTSSMGPLSGNIRMNSGISSSSSSSSGLHAAAPAFYPDQDQWRQRPWTVGRNNNNSYNNNSNSKFNSYNNMASGPRSRDERTASSTLSMQTHNHRQGNNINSGDVVVAVNSNNSNNNETTCPNVAAQAASS